MPRPTLALVLLVACSSAPPRTPEPTANSLPPDDPADHAHESMASIRRKQCFGWCPVYAVTIYRDGTAEYDGESFVKTKGHATRTLSPAELAELEQLFTTNGYMKLADAYTHISETDMPGVVTSYRPLGGLEKSVDHYLGDETAPAVLQTIEEGIDRILKIELWIGTDAERKALFTH